MSFLSELGKGIGKFLLGFFVITAILVYGMAQFTEYNSLKPIFTDLAKEQVSQQLTTEQLAQLKVFIDQKCATTDRFTYSAGGINLEIVCKEVQLLSASQLPDYIADQTFKQFYYKDYSCSVIECLQNAMSSRNPQDLAFIMSDEMNSFLKGILPYLVAGLIISILIIIVSIRRIFSIIKTVGTTLLSSGVAFIIILLMDYFLPSSGMLSGPIKSIENTFIYLYGIVFAIGIVLSIIGFIGVRYYEKDIEKERNNKEEKNEKESREKKKK